MAADTKDFIAGAIRHPGRLSKAAKANGKSTLEQARAWAASGSTSEKDAANLYLNALRRSAPKGRAAAKKSDPGEPDADD
jgi:hypothetical protein